MAVKPRLSTKNASPAAPEFFSTDVVDARRFYLDLDPPRKKPLVVVCGGLEHCTPDYSISRETFPFYSIEYAARGRGQVTLKGNARPLQSGRVFSYGPGIPHHIIGSATQPLVKYFVDFAGTRAALLLRSCGLPPGSVTEIFPANSLEPLFDELIKAGLRAGRESPELCAKLLECLALRIAGARAPIAGAETRAFATYQQCRSHIGQHSLRLRTLKQMADECHVNNAYLCRLFRRYDNQTPYQYLLRLKMNHAAERLKMPGVMVKQVAAESGFADQFHFSRVFSSIFGLSPTAFRGLR